MRAITMSREYGSGGGEIGARLAKRLSWKLIDHQIVVDMVRFDGVLGADVLLEARWRVLGPEKKELVLRYSTVREPTGQSGYPALVAAMSRSLGVLSGEIADAVKALRASSACGGTVACTRGAHGSGGHSGSPSVPSFSSGKHKGFETPEAGTLPEPKGWDQGKAAWKGDTTTSTTDPVTGVTTTTTTEGVPPGFSKP